MKQFVRPKLKLRDFVTEDVLTVSVSEITTEAPSANSLALPPDEF